MDKLALGMMLIGIGLLGIMVAMPGDQILFGFTGGALTVFGALNLRD